MRLALFLLIFGSSCADWLLTPPNVEVTVTKDPLGRLLFQNGLISRTFQLAPNLASVDLFNFQTNQSVLRQIRPEAIIGFHTPDGNNYTVSIGGLLNQTNPAYINQSESSQWFADPNAFVLADYSTGPPDARYFWRPKRFSTNAAWPPAGLRLDVTFVAPPSYPASHPLKNVAVQVHYEMYENLPAFTKWVTIINNSSAQVVVQSLLTEQLALTEEQVSEWSQIIGYPFPDYSTGRVHMEVEQTRPDGFVSLYDDGQYFTHAVGGPTILESAYPLGPGVVLGATSGSWTSQRTYVLLHDSDDRERQGLSIRRMTRLLAPQTTENPIFMHLTDASEEGIRSAVDQCATVGFEMIILSFGTAFDPLNPDPIFRAMIKRSAAYAQSKGIELGGYSLMASSKDVGPKWDCINPDNGLPESNACLASGYADYYFSTVLDFYNETGLTVLETDGPYEGAECASTSHDHHVGLWDSQWTQYENNMQFYAELRQREVMINAPDPYWFRGSNKIGMGYVEDNWSLPRWQQILLARQNIYDASFTRIPTQGWMFVPLVQYHGGGAEATIEPLQQHLPEYEWFLGLYFGSGVMPCWRGYRLYDVAETQALVTKYVAWYKQYRTILTSDVVHIKRPDGKSVDGLLHVQPDATVSQERAFLVLFNQNNSPADTYFSIPLYYSGIASVAAIREQEGPSSNFTLARDYSVSLHVQLEPMSFTWFVIEDALAGK
eukprot:TRINITY_DN27588_c0_g1_i1.p1 TRINITY_DN27588_c0_g1~~TRINITY_DN27588_c0_g1_i1.p1  ORF type:complete len:718 (-),score=195.33 TRINITY_DN27588_c0_g1_i1:160-2313(-)